MTNDGGQENLEDYGRQPIEKKYMIRYQRVIHTGKPGETQSFEWMGDGTFRIRTRQISEGMSLQEVRNEAIGSAPEFALRLVRETIKGYLPTKK